MGIERVVVKEVSLEKRFSQVLKQLKEDFPTFSGAVAILKYNDGITQIHSSVLGNAEPDNKTNYEGWAVGATITLLNPEKHHTLYGEISSTKGAFKSTKEIKYTLIFSAVSTKEDGTEKDVAEHLEKLLLGF